MNLIQSFSGEPAVPYTAYRLALLSLTASACLTLPASAAGDFNSIVRAVLNHQTDGPLAEMDSAKRSKMTDCVIQALQPLPAGFKRQIVAGKTLAEQEHAFGVVVNDNHAKWKQNIAKACSEIATAD